MMATLTETNITLNSIAMTCFENVRWVMVGVNEETKQVAIKPVSKREVDLQLVPKEQLQKISIGKGYARITNKSIMSEIQRVAQKPLVSAKCGCEFDENEGYLILHLEDLA